MTRHLRFLPTLLFLAAATSAPGAPGDLDPTFNGTGKVVTTVPTGYSEGAAVVQQADGKLVVAGVALVPVQGNPDNLDFAVVRYDATGMLDASFGGDGIVTTAIRDGEDTAAAVIQQADGKLVVAGTSYDADFIDSTLTLVRYLANGDPDPAFGGGDGEVTTAVGSGTFDSAFAVIQQQDGKLVVAGYSDTDIVVVRYDASGTPDGTFDVDGIVTTTVGTSAVAKAILEQATDHKLVVAGAADAQIVLVRYGTTGTPDTMFNGTGMVTTTVGAANAEARAIVQQASDGKLVVAGISNDGTHDLFTLARYDLDGDLDTAGFGTNGIETTFIGAGNSAVSGLAQQADGKLVAAGFAENATNTDVALVRYDATGTPDASFGAGGVVITPIGTGDDEAAAVVYQPDGFLAAAGVASSGDMAIAAVRYVGIEGIVTTTTTSTTGAATTTTPGNTTTSTTLPSQVLFPGGPATKTESDCYLELLVENATASQIQGNKLLVCTDGDPCDSGPAGDDRCDIRIAACVNQNDPALPACTPPAALDSAKIKGKVSVNVPSLLTGTQCTPFMSAPVSVKRKKNGTAVAGKSKLVLKGQAKAPKGTSPRKDADKWTLQCLPSS